MTNARVITPERLRRNIPPNVLIVFEDFTNEMLLSLNSDVRIGAQMRAYAGWELDYRLALDLLVDMAPDGGIRKTVVTEKEVPLVERRIAHEAAALTKRADAARARFSLEAMRSRITEPEQLEVELATETAGVSE